MPLYELHVLVEMVEPSGPDQLPAIKRIVRTYESDTRAKVDLELLTVEVPGKHYTVQRVEHLES